MSTGEETCSVCVCVCARSNKPSGGGWLSVRFSHQMPCAFCLLCVGEHVYRASGSESLKDQVNRKKVVFCAE